MDIGTAIAILALVVTVVVDRLTIAGERSRHVEMVWQQVLQLVDDFPELGDIHKTENYLIAFDWEQRLRYETFCLQAWGACEQLVRLRRNPPNHQRLAIDWMATYHYQWLVGNSQLFQNERFWTYIERVSKQEPRLTVHRPVPSDSGLQSWDEMIDGYFDYFLSPFDPRVTSGRLEPLIEEFLIQLEDDSVILELGCGVGTLFSTYRKVGREVLALDLSATAIERALNSPDAPLLVRSDQSRTPVRSSSVNAIISINSILLESREATAAQFSEVARILEPNGVAFFLLPSYETILYLRDLRTNAALDAHGPAAANRALNSFNHLRLPDDETASYADDGVTRQAFHTIETINVEFEEAGLEVISIEKFRYPWELTRTFNYGFFPGEDETWDWIVKVERPAT